MLTVTDYARIRYAYYVEKESMKEIERKWGHSYWTIRKALDAPEPLPYQREKAKEAPVLGAYKARIEEMLAENERLPRKQRYTSRKIYETIQQLGYAGAESSVRRYVGRIRKAKRRPAVFLPLAFDPGQDAQVDWGEAQVVMAGEERTVQLFIMRLCYSRRRFVMAFPTQRQEAFFWGHVQAFAHFQGIPQRISYDNLKTAVQRILVGRNRQEQSSFASLRSHYLFESRYCTPGAGHEKGGVESDVGDVRRNFLTPLPQVADFNELNQLLLAACLADDKRHPDRTPQSRAQLWAEERPHLTPLPAHAFACCVTRQVTLNGYSQVTFETNRYSVPGHLARKQMVLRAYAFHIEIVADNQVIASHLRSYERQQEILDPLHYLPLLAQRPGAFEHALPLRRWREQWPPAYEELLSRMRSQCESESQAVGRFVQVLDLHQSYAADTVQAAVEMAVAEGLTSVAGVRFCLDRLLDVTPSPPPLDLTHRPELLLADDQLPSLQRYDLFLGEVNHVHA
jgi:transposase